eukprot:593114-Pyramimonas_sp.AAC.1
MDKAKVAVSGAGTEFACGRRRAHPRAARKRRTRVRKSLQRLSNCAELKSMRKADERLGRVCMAGNKMAAQSGVE